MQYFNFKRLIEKYGSEFTAVIPTEGYYDDLGKFVKGEPQKVILYGAIINHKESKVYRSEGVLTAKDKRLFMLEPISEALSGATIIHENKKFSIEDNSDNSSFTGAYAYTLKYISVFDKGDQND